MADPVQKTTIQTSTTTRDKLKARTPDGLTIEDTIVKLLNADDARRARRQMLLDQRFRDAAANTDSVARANRMADTLAILAAGDEATNQ
ncbi:hypothetical protein OHB26_19955 [Nocardia sp. NBC_01503]|uniref:hypothetical protein n=1 Tax=Nocardia sp. NBC_01503 TaxID=2975997 RepID=UPI002E7AEA45|nr:hypothetical protein [Nocardia sp. NBC_01503]WTL29290.1 hypothetical protein OHB26_19955 [Nocardia sp. NBC_01503]